MALSSVSDPDFTLGRTEGEVRPRPRCREADSTGGRGWSRVGHFEDGPACICTGNPTLHCDNNFTALVSPRLLHS